MIVKQLRLAHACYALKSEENILASDTTTIEMLHHGGFVVRQGDKVVVIPASNVLFAICEDKPKGK